MVWIHGGGFTGGAASDTTFDGNAMASRGDVVLVTINYRLSTLGFLALSNTSLTGNYGLHDQSVALGWLRAHVARSVIHSYSRMRDFRSHLVFIGWSFDIPLPLSLME